MDDSTPPTRPETDPYAGARDPGPDAAATARDLDDADPLSSFADRFHVPEGTLYADGNSLGPASDAALASLDRVVDEWRDQLIEGWTDADPPWFGIGERLGDRLAPLVGAEESEVVIGNSITVNIHTLVGTFLDELLAGNGAEVEGYKAADSEFSPAATGDGDDTDTAPAVLVNELDFPSDHYAIRAQLRQRGIDPERKLRVVESRDGRTIHPADVEAALEEHDDVGIVFMPTALYRSGHLFDVERIASAAHANGAYVGFDAAHTVGAVPHRFSEVGVDFAVWCSYKYLNAGPGAVAGLYVNERHHGLTPALAGWWGHEKATQFEMNLTYTAAASAGAWQIGTPPMLAAAPLEGALDVLDDAGIDRVRAKSLALTDFLVGLVDERLPGVEVGTPRDHDARGGHVALEHPEAYRVSQALKDEGVIVDFRPPNVVRICPAPLYTAFAETLAMVETLEAILAEERYERFPSQEGGGVT
ncbi:kynureninase [Haloparvum sp. PAK95]|uniref:kynureninase n=1 Tax=Haloparvum sp. PAK95 TaxID=3418962 RepID=UPI003D2F1AC2